MSRQGTSHNQTNIAVLSCVKNVASTLPTFLADIDTFNTAMRPADVVLIVFENGSVDDTTDILRNWTQTTRVDNVLLLFQKPGGSRTERLASCRNRLWERARWLGADVVIMIDPDYSHRLDIPGLVRQVHECGHTACFSASKPYIYDQWALRDARYGYTDVFRDGLLQYLTRWPLAVPNGLRIVTSAFNGLAVYSVQSNVDAFAKCAYAGAYTDGYPVCEHAPFHECLAGFGASFVIDGSFETPHSGNLSQTIGIHYLIPALICIVSLSVNLSSVLFRTCRRTSDGVHDGDSTTSEKVPLHP